MRPMRVLLLSQYYHPVVGGVEEHIAGVAGGLVERGVTVQIVCSNTTPLGDVLPSGWSHVSGIPVYRTPTSGVGHALRWPGQLIVERPDLVHMHSMSRPMLLRFLWERRGVPWVVTPHGAFSESGLLSVPQAHRNVKLIFDRVLGKGLMASASSVIALTADEADACRFVTPERRVVLPNPLPDSAMALSRVDGGSSRRLLVVARLAPIKRIGDVIRALQLIDDPPGCDIAGPDAGDEAALRKLAACLPAGVVRFLGPVYGSEKQDLLRAASALVLPSAWEGLSIAALESLAQETPVIASRAAGSGLPEEGVVRFPTGNIEALAAHIRELRCHSRAMELRAHAARGRARIASLDEYVDRLLAIYEEAIG